jgi:DNA-binding transcriptional MerR regulator
LRKWERAGLLEPQRDPATGYRVYAPADVRDAHLAHQLRRAGYLLRQIAPLIAQVRRAGGLPHWKRPSGSGAPGSRRAASRCSRPQPSSLPTLRSTVTLRPPPCQRRV